MKFGTKTLFVLTAIVAIAASVVVSDRRAWSEAKRMDGTIEETLTELDNDIPIFLAIDRYRRNLSLPSLVSNTCEQMRGGIFSGSRQIDRQYKIGNIVDIHILTHSEWCFLAAQKPNVTICTDENPPSQWFAQTLAERLEEKRIAPMIGGQQNDAHEAGLARAN